MAGYVLADVAWTDADGRNEYIALLTPSLTAYGGETVAASRDAEVMEGDWQPRGMTILISFPTREAALNWYSSEEYRPAHEIRKRSADSRLIVLGD